MSSATILIAEDQKDLQDAISTALTGAGFTTLTANNGSEAVSMALKAHPDVILMDIMMPELSGHDAVTKIRNDVWGKDAKIIFLTSLSDAENVVRAVESGSDEYIVKPHASLAEIVQKVREVLYREE